MKEKMKILLVHNYYQIPGGEDTVVSNEKELLEKHGHKVILYTRNNQELKKLSFGQKLLLPLSAIYNPRTCREVRKIIKEQQIDIVHVHNTLNLISPSVYYAAFSEKIPVVQTIHNFRLICPGATLYREGQICEACIRGGLGCAVKYGCYRNSRIQTLVSAMILKIHRMLGTYRKLAYICLTEFNREKILEINKGNHRIVIDPDKVFIKPNFSAQTELTEGRRRESLYLFAGRIDKLKGLEILLEAWSLLPENLKLVICGTGPLEEKCRCYIEANQLKNVEMKGLCSGEEVQRLLGQSRAMILPTQWYEGFPMSILESFSAGTPVLCSDLGNAASIVEDGKTGFLFAHNSAHMLAETVKKMEKTDFSEMTARVKEVSREKYSEEENYRLLMKIYETVLNLKKA